MSPRTGDDRTGSAHHPGVFVRTAPTREGTAMARTDGAFVYVATYPNEATAQEDYQIVKGLHAQGLVGSYDAAVVTKDASGKVRENKDETATRHGAWWGIPPGPTVGFPFRPSIPAPAPAAGEDGLACGHLANAV